MIARRTLLAASLATLAALPALAQDEAAATETAAPAIVDMAKGAADAPVEIVEYASFTCPHCAAFSADIVPQLQADYIDAGLVRLVHREVYMDRFGLWASMIARCGGEMKYFGIADMLYAEQRDWVGDGEPAAIAENLRAIGRRAGLNDEALDACMSDEATAQALVEWSQANAEAAGVQGTPTLVINGETVANAPWSELKPVIDAAITEAGATPPATE